MGGRTDLRHPYPPTPHPSPGLCTRHSASIDAVLSELWFWLHRIDDRPGVSDKTICMACALWQQALRTLLGGDFVIFYSFFFFNLSIFCSVSGFSSFS